MKTHEVEKWKALGRVRVLMFTPHRRCHLFRTLFIPMIRFTFWRVPSFCLPL